MENKLIQKNQSDTNSNQEICSEKCSFDIEEIKKIAENEKALRQIMLSSANTFNFEQIINSIVTEAGKFFKADRCFYIEIDFEKMKHKQIEKYAEYLSSNDIKSHLTRQPNQDDTSKFIQNAERNKVEFVEDITKITLPDETKKMLMDDLSVKSYLIATVNYNNVIYGSIVLHYVNNFKTFNNSDVEMIKTIARQAATVIHQAKLYEAMQKTARRETILRKIIEITRSSMDITQVKNKIVNELGILFKADRCYFRSYDRLKDKFLPPDVEYLESSKVKSLLNIEPNQEGIKYFSSELKKRVQGFYPVVANLEMAKGTPLEAYMKASGIVADYAMPILENEEGFIWLVLHYSNADPMFDDDYKKLLETIAFHVDTALSQIKLHDMAQMSMKKESLLRQITENIRSSLDVNQTLSYVCDEMAKIFNVQRASIIKYNDDANFSKFEVCREYKSNPSIKGILDNPHFNLKVGEVWAGVLSGNIDYLAIDNIAESDAPDFFKENYASIGQKSIIIVPIKKESKKWGVLILSEYKTYRHWTHDDINLLQTISAQIYIAIHQAELYSKMQQQVEREKAILANLPFMAWLKDEKGRFLVVNEAFASNCNTSAEAMVGKTDLDFFPKDLAQNYMADDMEVVKTGKPKHVEEEIIGVDGCSWHETYKTPVLDQNGKIVGTTGFARDITERKEVDRIKNEFISTVSHELRTPLTSLSGSLELILSGKMGDYSDKIKTLLNMAYSNCFRLTNLINDILDIEKIEAGKMDFDIKDLELMPIIKQALQLNLQYAQKYNVEIKMTETLPDTFIKVDAGRLIQVITNLLSNAIKFSQAGSSVDLSAERINDTIRISVTNYGAEISKEFRNRIFQKFAQADSSDSRQKGGTGLGLSISKLIIEKMDGQINFVSENNKTTFFFDLPELITEKEEV